jgi:hypothetical protein
MLKKFFGVLQPYSTIVFSTDVEYQEVDEEEWKGFVQTIKNAINKSSNAIRIDISKIQQSVKKVDSEVTSFKEQVI